MTTMTDRHSCIVTDDGVTGNFPINLGCLQGDRPSCQIFKIAVNPLILKLIASNNIKVPPEIPFLCRNENEEPDILTGFADDINMFFTPTPENILEIKTIIDNFGRASNLKINASKTKLIIFGGNPTGEIINAVNSVGFKMDDKVEILGLTFNNTLSNLDENWSKILTKIHKICNYWNLYHLSLPGRLNVVKSYIYSQLSYLATILTPPDDFLAQLEVCITNFLKQAAKISKNRIFEDTNLGGLGIPKPALFCESLKINMFLKGIKSKDMWGHEIRKSLVDKENLFSVDASKIDRNMNPIIFNLASAFEKFMAGYFSFEHNYKKSPLLNMSVLNKLKITESFITTDNLSENIRNNYSDQIKNLTFDDFLGINDNILPRNVFCDSTGIPLPSEDFKLLKGLVSKVKQKYKNSVSKKSEKIADFLNKKKIKSKSYRKYLNSSKFNVSKCIPTKTRYRWCGQVLEKEREMAFYETWTHSFIPMSIRELFFMTINNKILLNANLSHFNDNINPSCTFCSILGYLPPPRENFEHFFLNCPKIMELAESYFTFYLENSGIAWENNFLLLGAPANIGMGKALSLNVEIATFLAFILKHRKSKKIPLLNNLKHECSSMRRIYLKNSKYRIAYGSLRRPV